MKAFISPFCCNNCLAHAPFSLGRRIEKITQENRHWLQLYDRTFNSGFDRWFQITWNKSSRDLLYFHACKQFESMISYTCWIREVMIQKFHRLMFSICLLVADICKYVSSAFSWLISSGVFFGILVCLFCSTLWRYSPFSLYLEFGRFFLPRFLYLCSTKLVSEAIIHFTIEPCEFCQFS